MAEASGSGASLADFIWKNAENLWGDFKHTDFGKVILPFTLLRRLECVLEATRKAVDDALATLGSTKTRQNLEGYVARFRALRLSDEEARAIVAVREQGAIDNAMYRELNRVDTLVASQALRRLLEQKGRSSATYYLPIPRLLGSQEAGATGPDVAGLSSNLGALASNPADLPSNLATLQSTTGSDELLTVSHLTGVTPRSDRRVDGRNRPQHHPPQRTPRRLRHRCRHRSDRPADRAPSIKEAAHAAATAIG